MLQAMDARAAARAGSGAAATTSYGHLAVRMPALPRGLCGAVSGSRLVVSSAPRLARPQAGCVRVTAMQSARGGSTYEEYPEAQKLPAWLPQFSDEGAALVGVFGACLVGLAASLPAAPAVYSKAVLLALGACAAGIADRRVRAALRLDARAAARVAAGMAAACAGMFVRAAQLQKANTHFVLAATASVLVAMLQLAAPLLTPVAAPVSQPQPRSGASSGRAVSQRLSASRGSDSNAGSSSGSGAGPSGAAPMALAGSEVAADVTSARTAAAAGPSEPAVVTAEPVLEAAGGRAASGSARFDLVANFNTLLAVTGIILWWRGVWTVWDQVVGFEWWSQALALALGMAIVLGLRAARAPMAERFMDDL